MNKFYHPLLYAALEWINIPLTWNSKYPFKWTFEPYFFDSFQHVSDIEMDRTGVFQWRPGRTKTFFAWTPFSASLFDRRWSSSMLKHVEAIIHVIYIYVWGWVKLPMNLSYGEQLFINQLWFRVPGLPGFWHITICNMWRFLKMEDLQKNMGFNTKMVWYWMIWGYPYLQYI